MDFQGLFNGHLIVRYMYFEQIIHAISHTQNLAHLEANSHKIFQIS